MVATNNFSRLLPNYLTDATRKNLEVALKDFINNDRITQDPFSPFKNDFFLQGDLVSNIPFPYWKEDKFHTEIVPRCIILSNTCDIDIANKRKIPLDCLLAPVLSLEKYEKRLAQEGATEQELKSFYENLKQYKITNLFHLPIDSDGKYAPHEKGYIVQLDKSFYLPRRLLDLKQHIRSLNQFFSYLFTFQISVNLCRFHDKVDRDENICY
ncbi:hypothetical protein ACT4ZY_13965 [Acinetobacter baumannii]